MVPGASVDLWGPGEPGSGRWDVQGSDQTLRLWGWCRHRVGLPLTDREGRRPILQKRRLRLEKVCQDWKAASGPQGQGSV